VANIVEKYRPTTLNDFVDNQDNIEIIINCIKSNTPVLIASPPGTGKTSISYVIAKELGYHLLEYNASDERKKDDLKKLKKILRSIPLVKSMILLDEVDGLENKQALIQILKKSQLPVILTANDKYKVREFNKVCKLIEFKLPALGLVAKRIRFIADKEGLNPEIKVDSDIRSAINRTFSGSNKYVKEKSDFNKVQDIFRKEEIHDINPTWLIDNVTNFYSGHDVILALEIIKIYDKLKNPEILRSLPKGYGKPQYPYYFSARSKHERHN